MPPIVPCLWFDGQGEEAARLYTDVFPNSRVLSIIPYPEGGPRPAGSAMTVSFELDGQEMLALNGGPAFSFTEAISLQVRCEDQDEIDHYWDRLSEAGEPGPCGWLKDRFGLSWQVAPRIMPELLADPERASRVTEAFMKMQKIDLATLLRAADRA